MITIRLKGGMGNQMFQYAFARGLAAKLDTDLKVDCSLLLDRGLGKDFVYRKYDLTIFDLNADFNISPLLLEKVYKLRFSKVGKLVRSFVEKGTPVQKERYFHVDQKLIDKPIDNVIYDGWWQSEQYFKEVSEEIRKSFSFRAPILPESKDLFDRINNTNSICLNVRRTDFLTNATLNATNLEYFLKAAKNMSEMVDSPHFFIFSDDTEWCKKHLILDHPTEVVKHNHKGFKFGNYLQLMKSCKNFIIPNSSFAWWAVWLSEHRGKHVIAPKNWFNEGDYNTKDLVPDSWIRL